MARCIEPAPNYRSAVAPIPTFVCPLVYRPLPPILGQGGAEFAAEIGEIGEIAVPDQVRSGRETLKYVSEIPLGAHGGTLGPLSSTSPQGSPSWA